MGKKHKLIRVSGDKLRKDAHNEIKDFIDTRYAKGKDTALQDIQDKFRQPPFSLSEGTVINYLNELVGNRKLSTWKVKNRRYYGPPKISLPIKVGIAIAVIIIGISVLIDIFVPPELIYNYVYLGFSSEEPTIPKSTMLPLVVYLLTLTTFFTLIWYVQNRKLYK